MVIMESQREKPRLETVAEKVGTAPLLRCFQDCHQSIYRFCPMIVTNCETAATVGVATSPSLKARKVVVHLNQG
jgi:hypothetical protein